MCEVCSTIVEQACVYCTINNRKCAKRSQQLYNRLVCIVRVITVSERITLTIVKQACMYCTSNNRKCAKSAQQSWNALVCIVRVITVSVRSVLNSRGTRLCVLYE